MSTLADLRLRFVDIIGRLDFLTGGKATNTDNGANDFLQRAVRELDLQAFYLSGGDKNRKFIEVLAEGDYTFTIPEFLELDGLRMITATGERDMTDGRLDLREFRNRHSRPYSDWSNGTPFDWAINDDILQEEQESSIPQDALGQGEVRRIPIEGEILNNASFDDVFVDSSLSHSGALIYSAPWWELNDVVTQRHNRTDKRIDINGVFTDGDMIFQQKVEDMRVYPDLSIDYLLSVTISNYVEGAIILEFGGDGTNSRAAAGTFNRSVSPNSYATEDYVRVTAVTTGTINMSIDSLSLTEIGDVSFVSKTLPKNTEERKGIIFFPPTDEARTVEVYGKFFTPTMTRDTDVNFWSTMLPDLVAFKAAELYYSDLGNSARVKHFMDLIAQRIDRLDSKDALQEDNDAAGINQQPFRGVPAKWRA